MEQLGENKTRWAAADDTYLCMHVCGVYVLVGDGVNARKPCGIKPAIFQLSILSFSMPILDVNEIRQILPHRYPFLLVDRIIELEPERIVGIKNVTANEPFFNGHFPEFPVMPGVLIVEAMAQTAGVLVLKSIPDRHTKLVLLVSIDGAKFRRPVVPGDQLRIEMVLTKRKGSVAKMAGKVTVDGLLVAEAEMMCKLQDKAEPATPSSKCRFTQQPSSIRRLVSMTPPKLALATASVGPEVQIGARHQAHGEPLRRGSGCHWRRQYLFSIFDGRSCLAGQEVQGRKGIYTHRQPQ